jgi:YVTN family beta-propeller protein
VAHPGDEPRDRVRHQGSLRRGSARRADSTVHGAEPAWTAGGCACYKWLVGYVAGSELAPGTAVSGYRIEKLVGRGGMGAVYRADDEGLQRKVALKVIAPELAQDARFRERFLRESRIAASLDHPHVIPIHQAGAEGGLVFLAMRYVEGTDLARLLASEGALEPRRAVELLAQVAEALDAAHEQGLVHRDVKPANVLIASAAGREHCYLSDFGLTKRMGSLSGATAAGEIVGTLDYVAPEQITGAPLDAQADVYSLGCVLYECLTGEPPLSRATDVALLWAHVHEQPTPPSTARPGLPRALDAVLARALAKDPDQRHRAAGELIAASREALGIGELRRARPPAWRRAARAVLPASTRVRALAAIAAVVAAAAATAAVVLTAREPAPVTVPPDSVAVINPASNRVVEALQVGGQPGAIAVGAGAVWVANEADRTLTRLEPATRAVERRIALEGTPTGVAAGPTGVWVALGLVGSVARVDPAFDEVVATTPDVVGRSSGGAIAVGEGAAWLVSRSGELARIEPASSRVTGRLAVGLNASAVAVGEGAVWVANGGASTVSVVNPRTLSETTVSVGAGPSGVAVGAGAIWVASRDGTVTRIDARSFATRTIEVGAGPTGIAAGAGAVWVANRDDGTVSRIDPDTLAVTTIRIGNRPEGVALSDGVVWVSVQAR